MDGSLVKNSLRFSAILRNSQYKSNRPAVVHKVKLIFFYFRLFNFISLEEAKENG